MERDETPSTSVRLRWLGLLVAGICLVFHKSLLEWVRVGLGSGMHSCTLMIPVVSIALAWWSRSEFPKHCRSAPAVGVLLIAAGLVALSARNWSASENGAESDLNSLASRILALVLFIQGAAFQTVGVQVMRILAFPALFLFFMIPLPNSAVDALEVFFQHASAEVAGWFFALSGASVYHDELYFRLPGVEMKVAQECSGIRSSYALFLTSLIAGNVLLRSYVNRAVLAVLVVPLGIVRNAFRVFVLGTIATNYDRGILDSALHHQGGPIFFILSLIPFFAVVWWMSRRESRAAAKAPKPIPNLPERQEA